VSLVEVLSSGTDDTWDTLDSGTWLPFRGSPQKPNFNFSPFHSLMLQSSATITSFPISNTTLGFVATSEDNEIAITPTVRVTARWGYALTTPAIIQQATIAQAARWFKRGQSFWSDTAAGENQGQLFYRKPLDPDVKMMLELSRLVRPLYG
jgi:hypothetical protein